MENPLRVSIGDRLADLEEDPGEGGDGAAGRMERLSTFFLLPRIPQNLPESIPFDKRHRVVDVGDARGDREDRDDRGVGQGACDLGLPQKAALDRLILLQFGADPLQGHMAAANGILGQIDLSHAAPPQTLEDGIRPYVAGKNRGIGNLFFCYFHNLMYKGHSITGELAQGFFFSTILCYFKMVLRFF